MTLLTDKEGSKQHHQYLYNSAAAHPVEEYLPLASERLTSTPSFVLEVTWPRVVQFYHPDSTLCRNFRSTYLTVAREMRRRSTRIPVEYHAVSCAVFREVCQDFGVTGVPHLVAFASASIEPKVLKRTHDNGLDVQYVAEFLKVPLKNVTQEKQRGQDDEEEKVVADTPAAEKGQNPQEIEENSAFLHALGESTTEKPARSRRRSESALSASFADLYTDVVSSFIHTLNNHISYSSPLNGEQARAFREWLDLLHWALPARELAPLHNLVNDLRNNFAAIRGTSSRTEIERILAQHDFPWEQHQLQWSASCRGGSHRPSTCGFWKLLHVLSLGIAQQHQHVIGDLDRVSVSHAARVIRDFVQLLAPFGDGCPTCQQVFLKAYNDCLSNRDCAKRLGLRQRRGFLSIRTQHSFENLAVWIWEVHNQVNALTDGKADYRWPPSSECAQCFQVRDGALGWNHDATYGYLTLAYWPRGVQNPRLVVLDQWDGKKRRRIFLRGNEESESILPASVVLTLIVVVAYLWLKVWLNRTHWSGRHKKSDARKKRMEQSCPRRRQRSEDVLIITVAIDGQRPTEPCGHC